MKFFTIRNAAAAAIVAALALLIAGPALAVSQAPPVPATPYVAAFTPEFGGASLPYAGTMQLKINNGLLTGTYQGISVRPDPFNDHVSMVTGTVSDGSVMFSIGNSLSFTGQMGRDGTIAGTADYRGQLYDFVAKPGSV